jgi:acyl-CoA thioester hydrolase
MSRFVAWGPILPWETAFDRITEAKVEQSYIVLRDDTKIASGSVTLAVVDREGKLQRIPNTLRDPLTGS